MGLDTTHDAFHGAYSAFNRFRQAVAAAMGGSYPPHAQDGRNPDLWYWGTGYSAESHPGLYEFLAHSDCDGEISPEMCRRVADEMEILLPAIEEHGLGCGHIERDGGYGAVARRFIAGCRRAAEAGEPLGFH
jgi:hypothetical protein